MGLAKGRGRAIQIIYRFHIHPAIRDRDDQIRMPEAQFNQWFDPLLPINQLFANKIGTGYTQMDAPGLQLSWYFACG